MKNITLKLITVTTFALLTPTAFAHVTVKPTTAGVGTHQSFSVGVPVEKDIPTTSVRLVIPTGLEYVTPNTKPGWKIEIKKNNPEATDAVTEIIWSGGQIQNGFRDEFLFSAKAPSEETTLLWKAYQTYKDGTVVAWDMDPSEEETTHEGSGPASVTTVVDDLGGGTTSQTTNDTTLWVSIIALLVSLSTLYITSKKADK